MKTLKKRFGILSGALMGAAVLTRAEFIAYPLFLSMYLLFYTCRFSIRKFFMKYFLIYFFIALTMAPWTLRNYIVFKKFIPLSNSRGFGFLYGNNPSARGGWAVPKNMSEIAARGTTGECEKDRIYMQEAIRYIKTHPKRGAMLLFRKIAVHWLPFENGWKVFNPYYALALIFALIGIAFYRRRVIAEALMFIMFFQTTLTAMLTYGEPRYRYPYEIFLIIFAAQALKNIFKISEKTEFVK
jgi:4-amino-4-deoxy-L-arabinose transferase-like glycosyltransferase